MNAGRRNVFTTVLLLLATLLCYHAKAQGIFFLGQRQGLGLPSLVTSYAAAQISNPQTSGLYSNPPTVTFQTSTFTGYTTAYPSTNNLVNAKASYLMEGGLPLFIGGKIFLYSVSQAGASSNWATGSNLISTSPNRFTLVHTGSALSFEFVDNNAGPYFFRILVADGTNSQQFQYTNISTGYATPGTAGSITYGKIDFGTSATRTITIECPEAIGFVQWYRASGDTMSKPIAPSTPQLLFVGDSITLGQINNPASGIERPVYTASISTIGLMTVTAQGFATAIQVGQSVYCVSCGAGITITSLGTGTGGLGTYQTNYSGTAISSQSMNAGQVSFNGDTIARRAADYLGARAIMNAIGGTGYNTPTSGGNTTVSVRTLTGGDIAALYSAGLVNAVVFLSGINDASAINSGSQTEAANVIVLNAYFLNLAAWLYANAPNLPVCVGGNFYNSSFVGAGTNPTGINPGFQADIFAAVAAAKVTYPGIRIGTFQVNNILNGSGSIAAPAGNGNADLYLNADRTHPDYVGEPFEAASPNVSTRIYNCIQGI